MEHNAGLSVYCVKIFPLHDITRWWWWWFSRLTRRAMEPQYVWTMVYSTRTLEGILESEDWWWGIYLPTISVQYMPKNKFTITVVAWAVAMRPRCEIRRINHWANLVGFFYEFILRTRLYRKLQWGQNIDRVYMQCLAYNIYGHCCLFSLIYCCCCCRSVSSILPFPQLVISVYTDV